MTGYGMSIGCNCCGGCIAWAVDIAKDIGDVVRVATFGVSPSKVLAIEVDVEAQTGFGVLSDGVPVLKAASLRVLGWGYNDYVGVVYDTTFPTTLAEANAIYSGSTKATTYSQSENIIAMMPTTEVSKLLFIIPANAAGTLNADACSFYITRDSTDTALNIPTTDWRDRLERISEGIYETIEPLPGFMVATQIDSFSNPLVNNTDRRYIYELFTKDDEGVKTTLFTQSWEYIDIEDASTYREKLQTFTIDPGPLSNFPNPSSSGPGPAINWPRLIDGSRMLQSDGTRGKIWHREHVPSRAARNLNIADTNITFNPLHYFVNRRNVEFMPGFEADNDERRINGWSSSSELDLFEDVPIYVRFGINRGQTLIRRFEIQQYYETETGLNELCPTPSLRQPLIPSYSQLDLYSVSVNLGGKIFAPSYKAGKGPNSLTVWFAGDYIEPAPQITVSVSGSYAGGWTAASSSVSFDERFSAISGVGIQNIYATLPGGTITSLDAPYGYVYDPQFPRGTIASGSRHFWYDQVSMKWVYEGQTQVHFREDPPEGAELDTIVDLLADGGEYWFRTGASYFSIDDSGEITARDKAEFTSSPRYVAIDTGIGVTATNDVELAVILASLRFSLPSSGATTTFDISEFSVGFTAQTYSYRKIVRAWTEGAKPTFVFTYADYVRRVVSAGEISELYPTLVLVNGAYVSYSATVTQTSPTAAIRVPYSLSYDTCLITDVEITVAP